MRKIAAVIAGAVAIVGLSVGQAGAVDLGGKVTAKTVVTENCTTRTTTTYRLFASRYWFPVHQVSQRKHNTCSYWHQYLHGAHSQVR